jgi:hypothetical protein
MQIKTRFDLRDEKSFHEYFIKHFGDEFHDFITVDDFALLRQIWCEWLDKQAPYGFIGATTKF